MNTCQRLPESSFLYLLVSLLLVEAVMGLVYPTVLVARLVGLHVAQSNRA